MLGRDGVRAVADRVPGCARVVQFLALRAPEYLKDIAFSSGTPTVCHVLFLCIHRACQCDITGAVHRCHQTLCDFWFPKPTYEGNTWACGELHQVLLSL